jgi:hypothetical protein
VNTTPRWTPSHLARLASLLVASAYGLVRLRNPVHWDLLDDVGLAVHEAGHVLFQPFGEPLLTLGGSLFQVVVPLAFAGYFMRSRQRFAAFVTLFWVGASLTSVATYVADARAQELPLLGGENAVHDWWFLLTEWDLLARDAAIANWLRFGAAMAFLAGLVGGIGASLSMRSEVAPRADPQEARPGAA